MNQSRNARSPLATPERRVSPQRPTVERHASRPANLKQNEMVLAVRKGPIGNYPSVVISGGKGKDTDIPADQGPNRRKAEGINVETWDINAGGRTMNLVALDDTPLGTNEDGDTVLRIRLNSTQIAIVPFEIINTDSPGGS